MTYYHFSKHPFSVGDVVEARVSFPYPDAWAWVTVDLEEALAAKDGGFVFIVDPLGFVEKSPHHSHAYRSKQGFKVIGEVND